MKNDLRRALGTGMSAFTMLLGGCSLISGSDDVPAMATPEEANPFSEIIVASNSTGAIYEIEFPDVSFAPDNINIDLGGSEAFGLRLFEAVTNFRIVELQINSSGGLSVTGTLFESPSYPANSTLIIRYFFAETAPNSQIQFQTSTGEFITLNPHWSGRDGSTTFVEGEIFE